MRLRAGQAPVLLVLLLAFFAIAMPRHAHAAAATFDGAGCQKAYQDAMMAEAQADMSAVMNTYQNTPNPDIQQVYCWDKINAAFQMIMSVADPMSIVGAILNNIVQNLLNQLCTTALNAINSVAGGFSFLAQICIPMPSLSGFNSSTGSFSNHGSACNGIPLISVGASASMSNAGGVQSTPDLWRIFGQ